ncbi:MAG: glycosyltransferase family 4 protein [Acidimicrobiia bacterium]
MDALPGVPDDILRDPRCLVFVGTLDYAPNIEAARSLCREILPRVREKVPAAHVVLAGRRPGPEVAELAGDHVTVHGDVESVNDVFAAAGVAVYPGTTGRGTKNTVLEALAAGCPVVATRESVRGLASGHPVVTASTPADLGAEIASLIRNDRRRSDLSRSGSAFVDSLPGWDDAAARYADVFTSASEPGD